MSKNGSGQEEASPPWRTIFVIALVIGAALLAILALQLPSLFSDSALNLEVGSVASQDILAPAAISFQSQVLTEQVQDNAAASVDPIYSPPDSNIARQQVEDMRATLNFINAVREDQYATPEQKLADLAALESIELSQETAETILALNDSRWSVISQEAIVVLEQVMRQTIRERRLEETRRMVPALVSLSLPIDQADIVAELVAAFVVPNSLYNEELTEAARTRAREGVEPVTRSFATGEKILERGRLITSADLEVLERYGLLQPQNQLRDIIGSAALVLLVVVFGILYLRFEPELAHDTKSLALITILFLGFLFGARLTLPGHIVLPYLYPVAAFGLVLASLFGTRYGLILALPLSILVAYRLPDPIGLTMYYMMGSMFGVLALGRGQRVTAFIWAGIAVALASTGTVLAYRLPDPTSDLVGIATLIGAALLNGVASASLAVLLQFFLAQILGLTTPLQLLEISRPDNVLLQFILRNSPGTYQHSLQVANLAEQAAEGIGADALLTRVGALYHDAGKALNPYFFIENQPTGFKNPHDDLAPVESAAIIIRHVPDGVELARKYRLPERIQDFIREHHGTNRTNYQYVNAVKEAGGDKSAVDDDLFTYPGPRPQSRETALVMLADGCEARARAHPPQTDEEIRALVKSTVDARLAEGQLDDTALTTKDLADIVEIFISTMRGIYHPRIEYPKLDHPTVPSSAVRTLPEESGSLEGSPSAAESLPQTDSSTQTP